MEYNVLPNGRKVVRGATLNQLIIYLTSPSGDSDEAQTGSEFYMTALMTLQTFTEPEVFLRKLKERFEVPPCPDDVNADVYELEVRRPLQMRVCNLMYALA